MKKLTLLAISVISAFAIQDGLYHCIADRVADINTGVSVKLKEKVGIYFNVKQNGRVVTTEKDKLEYSYTYKNFDAFTQEGAKFTLLLPSNSVEKYFGAGIVEGNREILMACKKLK